MTDGPKLLEQAARALWDSRTWNMPDWDAEVLNGTMHRDKCRHESRAVVQAILPHLSKKSRARLEKELSDE